MRGKALGSGVPSLLEWGWVPFAAALAFLAAALLSRPAQDPEPFRLGPLDSRVAIPVLCYHGVVEEPEFEYEVSVGAFREQLGELKRLGRNPITATQLIQGMAGQIRLPSAPVVLTFDDGLRSVHTKVAPILREFGWKATAFMNPVYVGKKRLTWDEWRALDAEGWDIQSHGFSHRRLTREAGEDQESYLAAVKEEIHKSKLLIEEGLGKKVDMLAYPYGLYDKDVANLVQDEGYKAAFGLNGGVNGVGKYLFMLDRILVVPGTTLESFRRSLEAGILNLGGFSMEDGEVVMMPYGTAIHSFGFGVFPPFPPCSASTMEWHASIQGKSCPVSAWGDPSPQGVSFPVPRPMGRGGLIGQVTATCGGREYKHAWLFWRTSSQESLALEPDSNGT